MSSSSPLVPHYQKEIVTSMNSAPIQSVPVSKPGLPLLGPENTLYDCPFCNASIKTSVQYTSTALTYIAGALWCTACCLCCIPLCSDSTKNADHYCPSCHRYLGTYKRS
ncbi:lipopolysaccharide-induced tumor necrosis factor-alpha factor homolog isoform X2 [Choristoneura fumiferana]